jgi:acyl-CoA synthetase (AMP-forming)/AMP-acid ligase II
MTALAMLIERSASWFTGRTAVEDGQRSLSYSEVADRSSRLAHALAGLSPVPGARVALLSPNRLEVVEIDLALIRAGLVKVPINTRLKHEERAHVLDDCGAAVLVFDGSEEDSVADLVGTGSRRLALVRVGAGSLGAAYEDVLAAAASSPPRSFAGPDDPSLILYTSGTTGRPKGATTTFAARLMSTLNMLANEIDPRPGDAMAHVGSMAHGSGSKVLAHFVRGSRNVPIAKWDPGAFLDLAAELHLTHSFMVPTMIDALVERAVQADLSECSLRAISYGGAAIAPAHLAAALDVFGPRFVQVYGSCEAPHPVLVLPADAHEDVGDRLASAGRESVAVETRIVDDRGEPAADGEPGELLVRGPTVMRGYWDNPVATADVLTDGWYHTGDVVRRDPEGYVHIIDRARDVIITGGYNVYPAELEAVLLRHRAVAEVAIVGVPDDRWGEAVKAIVVAREEIAPAELLAHCNELLAGYKRPKSVEFVDTLPRSSNGKIQRRQIRERYWEGRARRV